MVRLFLVFFLLSFCQLIFTNPKNEGYPPPDHSGAQNTGTAQFDLPKFDSASMLLKTKKQIGFNPLLSVNTNRGSFETTINLILPPSLAGFRDLNLQYHSQNPRNVGLGIGWQWNLPMISQMRTVSGKATYQTQGLIGSFELIAINEKLNSVLPLVSNIVRQEIGRQVQAVQAYRPAVDGQGTLFIKIKTNADDYWLALTTSGQRWLFDSAGAPISFLNRYQQSLKFVWDQGLLTDIQEPKNLWHVQISYQAQKQSHPQLRAGQFKDDQVGSLANQWTILPMGLKEILYSSTDNGQKKILFENRNGMLTKSVVEGGLVPLFIGEYLPNQNSISTETNSLKFDDDKVLYQASREQGVEIVDKNDDVMYVDINGDGRSDRVVIGYSALSNVYNNALKHAIGNPMDKCQHIADTLAANLANYDVPIKVEIAVANSPSEKSHFVEDTSLDISAMLKANGLKLTQYQFGCKDLDRRLWVKNSGFLQFVDLDQDGLKDLLFVRPQIEFAEDKFLFAKQALFELQNGSKPRLNPFDYSGSAPTVFMQGYNYESLKLKWQEMQKFSTSESSVNALVGFSRWSMVGDANFKMNQESQIVDIAGSIGIMTGRSLYLIGNMRSENVAEHVAVISVNPMDYISKDLSYVLDHEHDLRVVQISQASTAVQGDNSSFAVLRLANIRHIQTNPSTSQLDIYQNGQTLKVESGSHPMLIKIQSIFGGEVRISYIKKDGIWVVGTVTTDPKSLQANLNTITEKRYAYLSPMMDPHRGTFIGFAETSELDNVLSVFLPNAVEPKKIYRRFSKDISPSVSLYQARARFNGKLLSEQIFDSQNQLRQESIYSDLVLKNLDSDRVWPLSVTTEKRFYQKNEITQRRTSVYQVLSWAQSETVDGEIDIAPDEILLVAKGKGFRSIHSDDLTEGVQSEHRKFRLYADGYLLNETETNILGVDDVTISPVEIRSYDAQGISLESLCLAQRCQKFIFDNVGRLRQTQSSLGALQNFQYAGAESLPKAMTDERGVFSFSFSLISGEPLSMQTPKTVQYSWDYSKDDILIGINKSSEQGVVPIYLVKINPEARSMELETNGQKSILSLDGLGRELQSQSILNGKQHWSGLKFYGESDQVLAEMQPYFSGGDPFSMLVRHEYNFQGLLRKSEFSNGDVIEKENNGACFVTTKNQLLKESFCQTGVGNILSQSIGNEEVQIDSTATGDILALSNLGISFAHNSYQEVISNQASNPEDQRMPNWRTENRKINELGDITVGADGLQIKKNSYGREILSSRVGQSLNSDISENIIYQNGLATEHQILDAQGRLVATSKTVYDSENRVLQNNYGVLTQNFSYDVFGNVTEQKISNLSTLDYIYNQAELSAILPVIQSVDKDSLGNVIRLNYVNGSVLQRSFEPGTHRLLGLKFINSDGSVLLQESLSLKDFKVRSRTEASSLASYQEEFAYDVNNYQLINQHSADFADIEVLRNSKGQTAKVKDQVYSYRDDNLIGDGQKNYFYDMHGSVLGACRGPKLKINSVDCVNKLAQDLYFVNGEPVQLVRFEGIMVAVVIKGEFYPVVSDHLGSLKYVISPNGKTLLLHRHFDAWGRKTLHTNTNVEDATMLDQKIPWSYAGLDDLSGQNLYWSQSRAYNANIEQWMTADPLVKWEARELSARPGNYYPYRYAGNDPLMMVDVSGHWAVQVGVSAGLMLGTLGGSIEGGFALSSSTVKGVQIGAYSSSQVRLGLGIYAGVGIVVTGSMDIEKVKDLSGVSIGLGIDSPLVGVAPQFSDQNGSVGKSVSVSVGPSLFGDIYGSVSETFVSEPYTIFDGADKKEIQ